MASLYEWDRTRRSSPSQSIIGTGLCLDLLTPATLLIPPGERIIEGEFHFLATVASTAVQKTVSNHFKDALQTYPE